MAGLDVAASAVGITSLGIQVCQGLLSYYRDWKDYRSDIGSAYDAITDLAKTLGLLKDSLQLKRLDEERSDRVKTCLSSCEDSLTKLSMKLQEVKKHQTPDRRRQKVFSEAQRLLYPFRKETIVDLREHVDNVRDRLALAVQVLQLDTSVAIEASTAQISIQQQSLLAIHQSDQFRRIFNWLSVSDPWTNHASARQRYEAQTGTWLLQSDVYESWKTGATKHVWMHGKAGCGKTILCSTVIEDIQAHSQATTNSAFAMFYFTFSDNDKQTYGNLMRSLVVQLGRKEPGLSMLQQAYDRRNGSIPGTDELERILHSSIESYDRVFLVLDALDESPEENDIRYNLLDRLAKLGHDVQNISLFVTSRAARDIREAMESLDSTQIDIATRAVNADIRRYVSNEMLRESRLRGMKPESQAAIEDVLSRKADGVFRWVYCQLQELKKLKSTKPKYVQEALRMLPMTLDETYTRMLDAISPMYRKEALTLLRWLAYAQRPPNLGELAEAAIIDPSEEDSVDLENRGNIEDTLEILGGLVSVIKSGDDYQFSNHTVSPISDGEVYDVDHSATDHLRITADTRIRLAHFSVKEFLESERIPERTRYFHLESGMGHRFLAHSCLKYLLHYSNSSEKLRTFQDFHTFPLLKLASSSWYTHSSLQQCKEVSLEVSFLSSKVALEDWCCIDRTLLQFAGVTFALNTDDSALCYASRVGLNTAVSLLLEKGADVNPREPHHTSALQAALCGKHAEITQLLLEKGADVNATGGRCGSALQLASCHGDTEIVQLLLEKGADVNVHGGLYRSALVAASSNGYGDIVQLLLKKGADVDACGNDDDGNAIYHASRRGHLGIVQLLLEKGADVNIYGGFHGNALVAAVARGDKDIIPLLLDNGADVNASGGSQGNAISIASYSSDKYIIQLLLENGADERELAIGGYKEFEKLYLRG